MCARVRVFAHVGTHMHTHIGIRTESRERRPSSALFLSLNPAPRQLSPNPELAVLPLSWVSPTPPLCGSSEMAYEVHTQALT